MKAFLILIFLISFTTCQDTSNYKRKSLSWGVSILDGVTSNVTRKDQVDAQLQALEIFNRVIMENKTEIVNHNMKTIFMLDWNRKKDNGNISIALENTREFCKNESIKVMFYTPVGDVATPSLEYIDKNCLNKLGMGANGLPHAWYLDKQRIFSIPPITDTRYVPILSFVNSLPKTDGNKKIKVALIYDSPHVFFTQVCMGLLDPKLQKNYNYEIVTNYTIPYKSTLNATIEAEIISAVAEANRTHANAVIACFTDSHGIFYLEHLKKKQYDFDLLSVTTTSPSYFEKEDNTYTDYVLWVDDYIPQIDKGSAEYFGNAKEFDNQFKRNFSSEVSAHPSVYRNLYAYISVMKAYQLTKSEDIDDVVFAMSRTEVQTIVGRLTYDSFHRTSIKPTTIQTRFNGVHLESKVVGPPLFANAKAILPIPKYRERVYNPNFTSEEYAFLAIALAFIAISVVSGIAILFKRHHPIIKSAAPLFMMGIIVGSILIYIGSIFFRIHQLSDATCHLQVWFLALGFILMFGCLFAKSFRVWRLWNSNLAKPSKVISDSQLALIVGVLASVQVLLLIIYSAAGDVKKDVDKVDQYKPANDKEFCSHNTTGLIIIILLVVYGFLLIIFGIFLAWTTRKVPFLAFNESKIVLFSMYNVAIFTLLALIVVLNAREMKAETEFVLHSICILLSSFVTVSISVGNKFYLILHGKTTKSKTQTLTQNTTSHSKSSITTDINDGEGISLVEFDALSQENEELKAKINALQSKVGEFEE